MSEGTLSDIATPIYMYLYKRDEMLRLAYQQHTILWRKEKNGFVNSFTPSVSEKGHL